MRFGFTSQRNGRALVVGLAGLASATLLLSACTANGGATGSNTGPAGGSGTSAAPTSTPPEVTVAITPAAQDINPTTPIVVKARRGTLTTVAVSNASSGAEVKGSMSADNTTWTSSEPLGYGSTYKVDAKAKDANGRTLDKPGQITTLKPKAQANPNLVPGPGSVSSIGVGQPIDFQFTQPVKDKAAVQRKLSVKSDPPQEGGWYWVDSKNAHY
ncbi:MAG: Ig-like domain-containing protein, partial [Sciscionella sp.]